MAKTLASTAIVTSAAKAAATTTRGRIDVSAVDGGIVTWRITNGGTAPTAQAVCRILIAHAVGSMPAAAAEGTTDAGWKQVSEVGAGLVSGASTRGQYRFGPEVAYIEVEFPTHTGSDVTVEAHATTAAY